MAEARDRAMPQPGDRVVLGAKHKATVLYVGPIEGQPGTWVGIEYDEAGKGKHDGSHGGKRYFACLHDPTAGSFVRLNKFLEVADFGKPLVEAARERYGLAGTPAAAAGQPAAGDDAGSSPGTQEAPAEAEQLYLPTVTNRRLVVEVLAPDAAARRLSAAGSLAAVLAQQRISSVGCPDQLRAALPSLTELDLSDNLVAGWSFVQQLAAALPSLAALNLSRNRLRLPGLASAAAAPLPPLAALRTLVLNACDVEWQQAVAVAAALPALRELHLCGNRIASLQLPSEAPSPAAGSSGSAAGEAGGGGSGSGGAPCWAASLLAAAFPSLEVLDLEDNRLGSWDDVALLSSLPRLSSLLLSGNKLTEVRYSRGFDALAALMLGSNQLSSWEAVSQLDRFPALREARLSGNPVTMSPHGSARYQCIARVSRLTTLNASAVGAAERWDAELNYLRQVTDELAAAGADEAARAAVVAAHPRWQELTQKYGELAPAAAQAGGGSSALSASMAQLTICHGAKRLQKKLPVSLTVGKLKLLLERLLRIKAAQQSLLLVPPEGGAAQPEDVTDAEGRELRYFDVADGWSLQVGEADAAARAAALASAKAEAAAGHAARMEQHEKTIQQFRAVEQRLMG